MREYRESSVQMEANPAGSAPAGLLPLVRVLAARFTMGILLL
jgi:hypothetical protein